MLVQKQDKHDIYSQFENIKGNQTKCWLILLRSNHRYTYLKVTDKDLMTLLQSTTLTQKAPCLMWYCSMGTSQMQPYLFLEASAEEWNMVRTRNL